MRRHNTSGSDKRSQLYSWMGGKKGGQKESRTDITAITIFQQKDGVSNKYKENKRTSLIISCKCLSASTAFAFRMVDVFEGVIR